MPPQSTDNPETGLNRDFFGTLAPGTPPNRRATSRRTRRGRGQRRGAQIACRVPRGAGTSQAPYEPLPRIPVRAATRRLRRESVRTAPIGERRHLAPAQRTAEQHGDDGAGAQPLRGRDVRRVQERLRPPEEREPP